MSDSDWEELAQRSDEAPVDPHTPDPRVRIVIESGGDRSVVRIAGELDFVSGASVARHCIEGHATDVVVDLAELTFLDCGGYRSFVAARTALAQHRRTLQLVGAVGEPRRLLALIQQLDASGPSCWSSDGMPSTG